MTSSPFWGGNVNRQGLQLNALAASKVFLFEIHFHMIIINTKGTAGDCPQHHAIISSSSSLCVWLHDLPCAEIVMYLSNTPWLNILLCCSLPGAVIGSFQSFYLILGATHHPDNCWGRTTET